MGIESNIVMFDLEDIVASRSLRLKFECIYGSVTDNVQ